MPEHLFFNELSLPFNNSTAADKDAEIFVEILKQAIIAFAPTPETLLFYRPADFRNKPFNGERVIGSWISSLEPDKRKLIISVLGRNVTFEDCSVDLTYDYEYNSRAVKGLRLAFEKNGNSISFLTNSEWDNNAINIVRTEMNGQGNLESREIIVPHLSREAHAIEYYGCSQEEGTPYEGIRNAEDIKEYATATFSRLIFGDSTFEFCSATLISQSQAIMILRRLSRLDDFFVNEFIQGNRRVSSCIMQCSFESQSTMEQYGKSRYFPFDGVQICCEEHIKLHSFNWRIHFFADYENGKARVGYIGPHLDIASS